jgi:cytochrome c oxidase subunit 3
MTTSSTALEAVKERQVDVEAHHDAHDHPVPIPYERQLTFNRLGMWLFLISETFLFAGILIMRIVLGRDNGEFIRPELDQFVGLLITSILLLSSLSVYMAETSIEHGKKQNFIWFTVASIVMGAIFMVGLAYEWLVLAHFNATDHISGGLFYFMTGVHGLHVLTGLFMLVFVLINGLRNRYSAKENWGVEATALYWHFVDVVWVFYYVALYLVGSEYHPH